MSISSILYSASNALQNYQTALTVHAENVANIDTEGYTRRTVQFEDQPEGLGANISSITRNLNSYLERQYLETNSDEQLWDTIASNLYSIEPYFTDDDGVGISSALDSFFNSFTELTEDSSDSALRQQVLESATQLLDTLSTIQSGLESQVESINSEIEDQVAEANELMEGIASYNAQISSHPDSLTLLDERDELVRQLSSIIDVKVIEDDDGQYTVLTQEGQTLVDDGVAYSLSVEGPNATSNLSVDSGFDGQIYFEGSSSHEFCIEMVSDGTVSGASPATYKVSLDGGESWLTDDDGQALIFEAHGESDKVEIDGVTFWFGTSDSSSTLPSTSLTTGDSFNVMAKTGLYWNQTTGGSVNITPLAGNDEENRITGGSLAGLFTARDEYIGEYQDELDALCSSLIWSVNKLHSQGAGLSNYSTTTGTYSVEDASTALGQGRLSYADQLESGSLSIALYDSATGDNISVTALDFSSIVPPGEANFDPDVHSLEDVRDAINNTYSGQLTASIENGSLQLTAADGVEFAFASDTTGLLAALGINTFFEGDSLETIAMNNSLENDSTLLCAGHVNGDGEVNSGDNTTATLLSELADKTVDISTALTSTTQTLSGYLQALCSQVGADAATAEYNETYNETLLEDISTSCEEVSGVNLDEELTYIMQYQQYYEACAKMIETASEMFEIVMSLK